MRQDGLLPVSVIVVNYNGNKFLGNCLGALKSMDYPKELLEIIVVDNGSVDGSVEYLAENHRDVKVIINRVNNYCLANNLAVRGSKSDLIALLNNDSVVDEKWLISLVRVFAGDERIGAAVGKILFPDGRVQSCGHYELPDFYWSDRGFKEQDNGQYSASEPVDSVSNCAVVFRAAALRETGGFDEDFDRYLEDVDHSIRLRALGWKIIFRPDAVVRHNFHGTVDEKEVRYLCERNRLLLIAKHFPDKLAGALFGSGYFTAVTNEGRAITDIFPQVVRKLIKHHADVSSRVVPELLDELKKIRDLEKDHLVKELDTSRGMLRTLETTVEEFKRSISLTEDSLKNAAAELGLRDRAVEAEKLERRGLEDDLRRCAQMEEDLKHRYAQVEDSLRKVSAELGLKEQMIETEKAACRGLDTELKSARELLVSETALRERAETGLREMVLVFSGKLAALQEETDAARALFQERFGKIEELMRKSAEKDELTGRLYAAIEALKGTNAEKESCIGERNREILSLQAEIAEKESRIGERNREILSLQAEIAEKKRFSESVVSLTESQGSEIAALRGRCEERDVLIGERNREIASLKETAKVLHAEKETAIAGLAEKRLLADSAVSRAAILQQQIDGFYSSRTFRFVVSPLWKIADSLKTVFRKRPVNSVRNATKYLLVIKPYAVSTADTLSALERIKAIYPGYSVILTGTGDDAGAAELSNAQVAASMIYSARKKCGLYEKLRLINRLGSYKCGFCFVLIGDPVYQGYRKYKLLSLLVNAPVQLMYYIRSGAMEALRSKSRSGQLFLYCGETIVLFFAVGVFVLMFVFPMRLRKILRR